ncbi:transposase (plasmid) [Pararobbsia alpina]
MPPGAVTRIVFTDAAEAYRLYLSQALLPECHEHIFQAPPNEDIVLSDVSFLDDRPVQYLIRAMLEIDEEDASVGHPIVDRISLAIASRCLLLNAKKPRKRPAVAPLSPWRPRRVTEHIDAHLFESTYLKDLADIAGLTRMHFATQFRLATGVTPNAYVLRRKVERAQQLLVDASAPGHWEGDLLFGIANSQIVPLVERQTRFVMLVKVDGKDTETVVNALIKRAGKLPQELYKSLTWDRGKEMADHKRFTVATDVKVYFCDPQNPWQRGSNENTKGLLRKYFPKRP